MALFLKIMKMEVLLFISLKLLMVACQVVPEQRLITDLLVNYSSKVRPVSDPSDTLNVSMSFHLTKVVSLESDTQVFSVSGWLQVIWNDPRLTWNPADYGNIERTSFYSADVWFPDFALENGAHAFYELAHTRSFRIEVDHTGKLDWEPGGRYETYCHVDVFYYPFDTQTCDIRFTEWGYTSKQVALRLGYKGIYKDSGYYQKSGPWRIVETSAREQEHQYEGRDKFSRVIFTIKLNRLFLYYFVTMLFPAFILSSLVLMVFGVPRGRGERLSMGLTLMLSFFVFMLNISNFVPKSTETMPLIQFYLLFYMAVTAITVGLSVMMLWLNHTKHVHRPPYWLRFLVYRVMATIICYGACSNKPRFKYYGHSNKDQDSGKKKGKVQKEAASLAASNLVELEKLASDAEALEAGLANGDGQPARAAAAPSRGLQDGLNKIKNRLKTIEQGTVGMMSFIWQSGKDDVTAEKLGKIKEEWKEVTSIINKFSFCVLLTFTIAFFALVIALWVLRS